MQMRPRLHWDFLPPTYEIREIPTWAMRQHWPFHHFLFSTEAFIKRILMYRFIKQIPTSVILDFILQQGQRSLKLDHSLTCDSHTDIRALTQANFVCIHTSYIGISYSNMCGVTHTSWFCDNVTYELWRYSLKAS